MAGKHHQQTRGVLRNPPVHNQETTLGKLLIETLIHIPLVEVTLVLETPIQEDIPDKTQVGILQEDTRPLEVTLSNLEEGITRTKTLQGVILELEAIQLLGDIPTNLEEAIIPTSILQVGTLRLEAIQLLGDTSQAEAAIQTSIQVVIQQLVDILSEEGALGRAGVHQALTLEVILVVE